MGEADDDFKYIIRVANTDLDGHRPVKTALQSVKGIGARVAYVVSRELGVDPEMQTGKLSDAQVEQLQQLVGDLGDHLPPWMVNRAKDVETGDDLHLIANDVDLYRRDDINRLKKIRCYRGVRHERGLKVRGQRTRSNGRSGLAMGVSRKKVVQQAQAEKEKEED